MDYENMNREELIEELNSLKKQRAFTYEDQMKLAILDQSPFTVWASDRECKIKLWCGQCEALYGYPKSYALGKDYVNLFVAPDEQPAARIDQASIIDEGEIFHNIANDIGKNGNTLQLITNCFRIKDINTGDFCNAEMGLIIDFLEQEKERLDIIVSESRKVKSIIDQFVLNTQQCKEYFHGRKKAIRNEFAAGERVAVQIGKRMEYRSRIEPLSNSLEKLYESLSLLIEDYYEKIQGCASSKICEDVKVEFNHYFDEILLQFERIAIDFEEILLEFNGDNTVIQIKESIFKEISERNARLATLVFERINKLSDDISDYHKMTSTGEPKSSHYAVLVNSRDKMQQIKIQIQDIAHNTMIDISETRDSATLMIIRRNMLERYDCLEQQLI